MGFLILRQELRSCLDMSPRCSHTRLGQAPPPWQGWAIQASSLPTFSPLRKGKALEWGRWRLAVGLRLLKPFKGNSPGRADITTLAMKWFNLISFFNGTNQALRAWAHAGRKWAGQVSAWVDWEGVQRSCGGGHRLSPADLKNLAHLSPARGTDGWTRTYMPFHTHPKNQEDVCTGAQMCMGGEGTVGDGKP